MPADYLESKMNVEFGWNSFNKQNMSMFKEILATKVFSDVNLVTQDKVVIGAHRFILSSRSKTLKSLLMRPDSDNFLTVECITSDVLKPLLEFMYIGQTQIEQNKVRIFIDAANYLQLNTEIQNRKRLEIEETVFVKTEIVAYDANDKLEFPVEEKTLMKHERDSETLNQEKILSEYEMGVPSTKEDLKTPLIICEGDVKPPNVCKKCKRKFNSESKFRIHTRLCITLGGLAPFKCNDCGSAFKKSCHLKLHHKPINRCKQLQETKSSFENFLKQLKNRPGQSDSVKLETKENQLSV